MLPASDRRSGIAVLGIGIVVLLFAVMTRAWVEEDAFITFRVVDNVLNGHGLRWNIDERVQVYTNPLWLLVHIPVQAIVGNIIVSTILVSLACVVAVLVLVVRRGQDDPWRTAALIVAPMALSRTQVYFLTSGLEYAMLALLFTGFWLIATGERGERRWLWLTALASLSAVCRLDSVLVHVPLGVFLAWQDGRRIAWRQVLLGATPIVAWLLFALWYYGFALPNTYYAKLATGIPRTDYLASGVAYVYDFVLGDPVAGAAMIAAVTLVVLRWRRPESRPAMFALAGMLLYTAYVVDIGGYQLALRMMALPSWVSLLVLWHVVPRPLGGKRGIAILAVFFLLLLSTRALAPVRAASTVIRHAQIHSLPWARNVFDLRVVPYRFNREQVFERPHHGVEPRSVVAAWGIGQDPYYAGPGVFIIDRYGLGDPLLARLPAADPRLIRVGHVERKLPDGYEHAVRTGDLGRMQPDLAAYYAAIRRITRDDLWHPGRLRTVIGFNLGEYRAQRDRFLSSRL